MQFQRTIGIDYSGKSICGSIPPETIPAVAVFQPALCPNCVASSPDIGVEM